ncbi:MAG: oligosaccharide flippase family protein, partial [Paenibacillus sp.]|nr:oligosaccharide flippase family protein [Paenibacillus sp.]
MLKQIILYFFSHGIPGVITFLSVAVYSRMMLPEEYGVFALAMTVVSFLNSVMFQWLRLGFLRFFPRDIEAGQMSRSLSTVAAAFMIVVVLTASLSSIGYIVMGSTAGIAGLWLMSMLIGWAQAWFELQLTFFRSQMQGVKYGILSLIRAVLVFLLSLLAIGYGLGAYGLLGGLFTGLLLSAAIPTMTIWTKHIRIRHVDLKLLRELLHYGLPLTLTFALS